MPEADDAAPSAGPRPERAARAHVGRAAALLGFSTTMANVLGYGFAVVLSRSLGPSDFGALAALLAAALIGSIPGVALQLAVARSSAAGSAATEAAEVARWLRIAVVTGVLLMLGTWALAPLADSFLALPSPAPVLWLGVVLLPTTVTGAFQGRLLGAERHERLSATYLAVAGFRFVAGVAAAWLGWSITGALAGAAVASLLACVLSAALAGVPSQSPGGSPVPVLLREMGTAASATAAILVLANVDVLLARHYLPAATSGHYAVGSLFTKAAFWAPHFLAVLAYPILARRTAQRRALLIALGLTVAIGLLAVTGAAVVAHVLIDLTTGPAYADIAPLAPAFAVLGMLMAVLQLMVYAGLARRRRVTEAIVWSGIVAETALVAAAWHGGPGQILAACIAVNTAVAVLVVGRELGAARAEGSQLVRPAALEPGSAPLSPPAGAPGVAGL